MQKPKFKMQNDRLKFKKAFKKRLYVFVLRLVKFVGTLNLKDPACRVITDQLIRSGTSVLSNYIEGLASSSKKEFTNFFNHSLKSAKWLLNELDEIANIFASSILTLKDKR